MNPSAGHWYGWSSLALVVLAGLTSRPLAADKPATKAGAAALTASALAREIDRMIEQRLRDERIEPAPLADDAEFLRRAYLDIAGVIPSPDKAADFLDNRDPDKRARVIDELLASPRYGRRLADVWQVLLFPRSSDNRRMQPGPFIQWLEKEFNDNTPWDQLVNRLLTATGTQETNGAVTYFLANPTPDKLTDSVSSLFLGVQLQCAQCHNHPFTSWKQTEYWGMAAFFMKVRPDNVRKATTDSPGVSESKKGKGKLPESAKIVPAKFLQGAEPRMDEAAPYRPVLAEWLTGPENPFFARAMVNRTWAQFFGRGIVNPIDDMHAGNAPSHPELLRELSLQFASNNFDLKFLIRAVCNSQAYQRTSKSGSNADDWQLFQRASIRTLSPEMLYDSLVMAASDPKQDKDERRGKESRRGGANSREAFAAFFRVDADSTSYEAGIPQVLRLMNAPQTNHGSVLLEQALKAAPAPESVVERLYLGTLSRRPSASESRRLVDYVNARAGDVRAAYQDILWALVNSSEFALCR